MTDLHYGTAKRILETGGLRAIDYTQASVIGDGDRTRRPIFEEAACVVADFERSIRASRAALDLYHLWHEGHTYRELQRLTGVPETTARRKIRRLVENKRRKTPSPCNTVIGRCFNETDSARNSDGG